MLEEAIVIHSFITVIHSLVCSVGFHGVLRGEPPSGWRTAGGVEAVVVVVFWKQYCAST